MTCNNRIIIGLTGIATVIVTTALMLAPGRRHTIKPDSIVLKPGDVVLRRGAGMTSHAVLMADKGGGYSHVGIVVDSAGTMMIVHAVPGEPDFKGDPDRVKMETPQKFYAAGNAITGAVMRCTDSIAAGKAAEAAMQVYRRGTLFDHDYNDSDTTRMYCCELVEFAYTRAGLPLVHVPRHHFSLPGMDINEVILPSDFCSSPHLYTVTAF